MGWLKQQTFSYRGWDVQDHGVAESVSGESSLAGLQMAVFWLYPHMESRENSKLALIPLWGLHHYVLITSQTSKHHHIGD